MLCFFYVRIFVFWEVRPKIRHFRRKIRPKKIGGAGVVGGAGAAGWCSW